MRHIKREAAARLMKFAERPFAHSITRHGEDACVPMNSRHFGQHAIHLGGRRLLPSDRKQADYANGHRYKGGSWIHKIF